MTSDTSSSKSKILPLIIGIICILALGLGAVAYIKKPLLSAPDSASLPKFITADIVDLANYGGVSKFRSGAGHSFASSGEKCRSMKHYFLPKQADTQRIIDDPSKIPTQIEHSSNFPAYSPVDGEITKIQSEQFPLGKQIHITPTGYASYTIRLFHVYPLDTLKEGTQVTAGERIGSLLPYQQTDIAIQANTIKGPQYLSYFDLMTDDMFAKYQTRGPATRNDFIITKEARDAAPLTCNGERFAQTSNNTADWVYFSDYTPMEQSMNETSSSPTPTPTATTSSGTGSQSGTGGGSQSGSGGGNKGSRQ